MEEEGEQNIFLVLFVFAGIYVRMFLPFAFIFFITISGVYIQILTSNAEDTEKYFSAVR